MQQQKGDRLWQPIMSSNRKPSCISRKRARTSREFHGGLEDLLKFAIAHGIEEQLDGLHVAREVRSPSQHHQEDNQHEQ